MNQKVNQPCFRIESISYIHGWRINGIRWWKYKNCRTLINKTADVTHISPCLTSHKGKICSIKQENGDFMCVSACVSYINSFRKKSLYIYLKRRVEEKWGSFIHVVSRSFSCFLNDDSRKLHEKKNPCKQETWTFTNWARPSNTEVVLYIYYKNPWKYHLWITASVIR